MSRFLAFLLLAAPTSFATHANEIRIAKAYEAKIDSTDLHKSFGSKWGEAGLELLHIKEGGADLLKKNSDPYERKEVFSCLELEEALASNKWFKNDTARGQQESHRIAIHCDAIKLLYNAKPASTSYLDDFLDDTLLLQKLDPTLIAPANGESCRKALAARQSGQVWHDVWPHHAIKSSKENASVEIYDTEQVDLKATSRDESLIALLTPIAFADFNDDGVTDILIEYRNGYQLGLATLTRKSPAERITWLDDYCSSQ